MGVFAVIGIACWLVKVLNVVVAALASGLFFYQVSSATMSPTIPLGAKVLTFKSDGTQLDRFDVIVYERPLLSHRVELPRSSLHLGRVVGLPGDRLAVLAGDLWQNADSKATESARGWRIVRKPPEVQKALWRNVAWLRGVEVNGVPVPPSLPLDWLQPLRLSPDVLPAPAATRASATLVEVRANGIVDVGRSIRDLRVMFSFYPYGMDFDPRSQPELEPDWSMLSVEVVCPTAIYGLEARRSKGASLGRLFWSVPTRARERNPSASEFSPWFSLDLERRGNAKKRFEITSLDGIMTASVDGAMLQKLAIDDAFLVKWARRLSVGDDDRATIEIKCDGLVSMVDVGGEGREGIRLQADVYYLRNPFQLRMESEGPALAPLHEGAIPEGMFVVLGDNPGNAFDSRSWDTPFVHEANVRAKLIGYEQR